MKDRIRKVQDYVQMSQQDFAATLGISAASLSGIYTGRTQPTTKHVRAIHDAFPEVNVNWLLFGDGEMLISSANSDGAASSAPHVATSPTSVGAAESSDAISKQTAETPIIAQSDASLFPMDEVAMQPTQPTARRSHPAARRESSSSSSRISQVSMNSGKNIDNAQRKIKEIRVFFDDGTYESFVPSSK